MRELADSIALQANPAALRQRLADGGYLFFRGLLHPADVRVARDSVCTELSLGGWTNGNGRPAGVQRAVTVRDALADPSFRAALASRALNRLAYLPQLRSLDPADPGRRRVQLSGEGAARRLPGAAVGGH